MYGQDWASFAREIVMIEEESEYLRFFNRYSNISQYPSIYTINNSTYTPHNKSDALTKYVFDSVQSGGIIPTRYYAMLDDEG